MAYATVEDYESRYGTLGESEASRVAVKLDSASYKIDALVEKYEIDTTALAPVLTDMCCDYVHYTTQFAVGANIASVTHQAGSFMETLSVRSELGFDKWAQKYYGDVLGITSTNAYSVKVAIHDRCGDMAGGLNDW